MSVGHTRFATPFGTDKDTFFMTEALTLAVQATQHNEVPIGAVVVNEHGAIIGRGFNCVESGGCQIEHAEVRAITQACKSLKNWRLAGCWIYVTLEPCTMCMGLIKLSRLSGVVFAADSPVFGYRLDNNTDSWVYKIDALETVSGVCADESALLLKKFFQQKRKKGE